MSRLAARSPRIPLAPMEGWVTPGLVLLLCLTLAWAVDDVRWVLGRDAYLDFLPMAAAGGVAVGFIGPKVGWSRWRTHLIGAIFAALVVPLFAASVAYPEGASLGELYRATATSVIAAYGDIVVRNQASTVQYLHYLMSLGMVIWGTAQFASYAVFGHHRPLSAVTVVGLLLLGNMALTLNDQPGWSVATVTGGPFQIFNDATGQNAFWINNATNNVGISTTSPNDKLEVNGIIESQHSARRAARSFVVTSRIKSRNARHHGATRTTSPRSAADSR